jgi:hypothetical protein
MAIALEWAPTVSVEISVQFTAGVWTEVTSYVRSVDCEIPRPSPSIIGVWPVGSATIRLDNRTGRFTPANTAGPHYPNVLQGRHVRFRVTHGAFTSASQWYGLIDDWGDSYPEAKDGIATITAVQPSAALASKTFLAGAQMYPAGQNTHTRINLLLAAAGYSLGWSLDSGTATMAASDHAGDALAAVTACVDVEGGIVFCAGDGQLAVRHRHTLIQTTASTTVQATFGTGVGEIPYHAEPPLSSGKELVANSIVRGNAGSAAFEASNTAALGTTYADTLVDMLGDNDAQTNSLANGLLLLRKTQVQHPTSISFHPNALPGSTGWNQAFGRVPLDRVTVKVPTPWGATLSFACWVVGVRHEVARGDWWTTWHLMPAGNLDGAPWFTVGTSTVGGTHRIAW